jgi:hypothetical protein
MRDGIVAAIQIPLAGLGFDSNRSGIGIKKELDNIGLWKKRYSQKRKLLKLVSALSLLLEDPWVADRLGPHFPLEQSFELFKENLDEDAPVRLHHSVAETTIRHLGGIFKDTFKRGAGYTRTDIDNDMRDYRPHKKGLVKKKPRPKTQTDGPFIRFVQAVFAENNLRKMTPASIGQALTASKHPGRRKVKGFPTLRSKSPSSN